MAALLLIATAAAAQSRSGQEFHRRPDIVATVMLFGPEYAAIDITPYGRKGVVVQTARSKVSVADIHAVVAPWSKPAEIAFLLNPEPPYLDTAFLVPREALRKGGGTVRVGFLLPGPDIGQVDVPRELVPVQEGQSLPSGSWLDFFTRQPEGLTRATPYSVGYSLNQQLMISYIDQGTFARLMSAVQSAGIKSDDYVVRADGSFMSSGGIVAMAVLAAGGLIVAWQLRR